MITWRGRKEPDQPQHANGGLWDLSPASEAPREQTEANWAATLAGTDPVPLIWEEQNDDREQREVDLQHW
jgi:hypothetical protein